MMLNRTLHSLLIVSFIVALASASFAADQVLIQSKLDLPRCANQAVNVTAVVDQAGGAVSAVEVVLNVSNYPGPLENIAVVWDLGFTELPDRIVQVTPPLIRFAAMNTAGNPGSDLAAGTKVIAQITFKTADVCNGSSDISGTTIPPQFPLGLIQTQFVDASDNSIRPAAVTTGTVSIKNAVPKFTDVTVNQTLNWNGPDYVLQLAATDDDVSSCEALTFFTTSTLPDGLTLTPGGLLTFNTSVVNICFNGDIVVGVHDKCQAQDMNEGTIHFCVKDNPPAFTDKPLATNAIDWGQTFTFDFNATDPDPGPYQFFHVISGPGTIDVNTGVYTWNTGLVPPFGGVFNVTVKVDDGAPVCDPCSPSNSAEYTFTINVYLLQVQISKEEDVYLGQQRDVTIDVSDISFFNTPIGGFDFLIQYDASSMMFLKADPGSFFTGCEWEYFTYRFGANGNCGAGACPSGVLRVVAMGETTGGNLAHTPTCWIADAGDQLVVLHFLMSADANLECQFAPIRFVWYDCADNGISSQYGDTLYISKYVWDFGGFDGSHNPIFHDITGLDNTFPTLTGAPNTAECNVSRKGAPWRLVHFNDGGMDIICADSIDAVGDINMNNIGYEIADAVMFTNYFIEGIGAFDTHPEGSIAASDTNKDGITLSVADLVYLIRVIVGDALPYDKVGAVAMNWTLNGGVVAADGQVGGAALVVDGNVTPQLLATGMTMASKFDGQVTRIVVIPDVKAGTMNSFSGSFLSGIDREIVSIEMATPEGQPIAAKNVPTDYELSQNYPNPFNPSTKINVSMKDAGDYSLTIYNVQGQVVQVISGTVTGPQRLELTWDASHLASGVYFYKLTAGNFTDTKKAVFLK